MPTSQQGLQATVSSQKAENGPPLNNTRLLEYATHMLTYCSTPALQLPDDVFLSTHPLGNSCVSPVVAVRGWGLLALMADGKTKKELTTEVAKLIGSDKGQVHQWLGRVDQRLRGAVLFFAEYPKQALLDEEIIGSVNDFYSNKLKDSLQRMCFLCDHDSLRSSYIINRTVSEATGGQVQYVVREDNGPNRCTQTILVSAVDCTFYWKHNKDQLQEVHVPFGAGSRGDRTLVRGWVTEGHFHVRREAKGVLLRLDSYQNDINLILFMPANETPPTAGEVLELGKNISASEGPVKIFVPQFSVATPLCLRDCSRDGPFNMKRVFDREKSDLSGYIKKFHDFSPTLEVLWDHYHKVTFTIVNGKEKIQLAEKVPRLQIGFRERYLEAQSSRYCENHLAGQPANPVTDAAPVEGDAVFNEPFYFLVVQDIHNEPLIHCFGRFTNVNAVSTSAKSRPCA